MTETQERTQAREAARSARRLAVRDGRNLVSTRRSNERSYKNGALLIFLTEKTERPVDWTIQVYIERPGHRPELALRYDDSEENLHTFRKGAWIRRLAELAPARKEDDNASESRTGRFSPIDDDALFRTSGQEGNA